MSSHPENAINYGMDYYIRHKYETLRSLLNKNGSALQILSDLEADLNHIKHYDRRIKRSIRWLITESLLMAQELNLLTGERFKKLYDIVFSLRNQTDRLFQQGEITDEGPLALMLEGSDIPDSKLIGGKASGIFLLSKYFNKNIPTGFIITTAAYNQLLEKNKLQNKIRVLLNNLDITTEQALFCSRTGAIRNMLEEAQVPQEIEKSIKKCAKIIAKDNSSIQWAVRSSAVNEDGRFSFAGQFESLLNIKTSDLIKSYKEVIASRFSDGAVKYRMNTGIREVDTPMAVLFMPMIEAYAAGVLYTADIKDLESNKMIINAVPGLADKMIRGEQPADTFILEKRKPPKLLKALSASGGDFKLDYINSDKIVELSELALKAAQQFGYDLEIEWALDKKNSLYLLQGRRLYHTNSEEETGAPKRQNNDLPIMQSGVTIFPGRAEGPVYFLKDKNDISRVMDGSIVIAEKPLPELAVILPRIAALLVMEGNPVGHLATLTREFSVPCIFKIGQSARALEGKNIISVNATKRAVYSGVRWPGIRERVLNRIAAGKERHQSGPFYNYILRLTLLDPDASSFKAKSCKSVHDVLRFIHEMSVRSMFGFGDKQGRGMTRRKLQTGLPMKLDVIDIDRSIESGAKKVQPQEITSLPFQALWRGISDNRLHWPERWKKEMIGMPADFQEAVLGGTRGPRRSSDTNYIIIAKDYLNMNARLAYHYAMVDAMVGPGMDNNHVHFRFRGGGASTEKRIRRARFLESVLLQTGFGVSRQGDMVTAWMRRYPQADSEKALENLGRLIVCSRQLDSILRFDEGIKLFATYFLEEKYDQFS